MAKITIEINCGYKHCDECQLLVHHSNDGSLPFCKFFDEHLNETQGIERLPECLAAEVE